jgi:hypothetical protein
VDINIHFPDLPDFKGIKAHVEKHKVAYSVGAGIVIAGITCYIMRRNLRPMWGRVEAMPNVGLTNTSSHSFMFRSPHDGVI